MKRFSIIALTIITLGFIISSLAYAETTASAATLATAPTATAQQKKIHYLFVMRAAKAVIIKHANGYELTFTNTDPKVLYFSDRPVRKAGLILTAKFMDNWEKAHSNFQVTPPNGALIYSKMNVDQNGVAQGIAIELLNPVQVSNNSWKFQIKDLEGKISAGSYDDVSMFIDAGGLMQLVAYGD
jgi:hypothetical protein